MDEVVMGVPIWVWAVGLGAVVLGMGLRLRRRNLHPGMDSDRGDSPEAAGSEPGSEAASEVGAREQERPVSEPPREMAPSPEPLETVPEPGSSGPGSSEPVPQRDTEDPREPAPEDPGTEQAALRQGMARTRGQLFSAIQGMFRGKTLSEEMLETLEMALIGADVGVGLTGQWLDGLREQWKSGELKTEEDLWEALRTQATGVLGAQDAGILAAQDAAGSEATAPLFDPATFQPSRSDQGPYVILMVGVNGVGKTTTIGKLAHQWTAGGAKVRLVAGDTFRAAAVEQLEAWGRRVGCEVTRGAEGQDPASVAFEGVKQAVESDCDVVLVDTAGRLHTRAPLMEELQKVHRSATKARGGVAPDQVWLVVDATTGQNAVQQARQFGQALGTTSTGLTGVILTKLDGTAKGGVVLQIAHQERLPVRYVGVGEKAPDLRPFAAAGFVQAMLHPDPS